MTNTCDACKKPGACCRDFTLAGFSVAEYPTELHMLAKLATISQPGDLYIGVPYLPSRIDNGYWRFKCPLLSPDGRCTEYEHRPWTCRHYQPGMDAMCVMHDIMG